MGLSPFPPARALPSSQGGVVGQCRHRGVAATCLVGSKKKIFRTMKPREAYSILYSPTLLCYCIVFLHTSSVHGLEHCILFASINLLGSRPFGYLHICYVGFVFKGKSYEGDSTRFPREDLWVLHDFNVV